MPDKICTFYRKHEKAVGMIILFMIFLMAVLMYQFTPYSSDDFSYMNQWHSEEKLRSVQDIIYFQKMHYMNWGGRAVAHTIVQFLFLAGKPFSSLLNGCAFLLLGYMIHLCAFAKKNLAGWGFTLSLMYYLNSVFDETITWQTGNANYMWTTLLIMLNIYPFLLWLRSKRELSNIKWLFLPFAFLAGWTNENMAPTMILVMMFVIYLYYKENHKWNLYYIIAAVLSLIGCALLILAPGNGVRSSEFSSFLMSIAYRGHGQVNAWFNWLFMPLITALILFTINRLTKKFDDREKLFLGVLLAWAVVSILIMVASPTYPQRATFGTLVILLIMILYMTERLTHLSPEVSSFIHLLYVICAVSFIFVLFSIDLLAFVRGSGVYIPG